MTALLLHAVTPADEPAAAGPRDQPARRIEVGRLALWATEWTASDRRLAEGDALAHHALVEALWRAAPCLPIRLGTWADDERAARSLVEAKADALAEALERVRERCELAVTLVWSGEPPVAAPAERANERPTDGPGRRYLEDRRRDLAVRQRAEDLVRQLRQALDLPENAVEARIGRLPRTAASLALLVPMNEAETWIARVRSASAGLNGVRAVVAGPWPPYSFSTIR